MQTVTPSGLQANPKCAVSGRGSKNTSLLSSLPDSGLRAHGDPQAPAFQPRTAGMFVSLCPSQGLSVSFLSVTECKKGPPPCAAPCGFS